MTFGKKEGREDNELLVRRVRSREMRTYLELRHLLERVDREVKDLVKDGVEVVVDDVGSSLDVKGTIVSIFRVIRRRRKAEERTLMLPRHPLTRTYGSLLPPRIASTFLRKKRKAARLLGRSGTHAGTYGKEKILLEVERLLHVDTDDTDRRDEG
jgi:uncharacterized protein (UPF0335 family)